MMKQEYYDLVEDKEFEELNICKPEHFESDMDERFALQYFVSSFRMSINLIRRMYGYEARQKTLYVIARFLEHARATHIPFDELEGTIATLLIDCGNLAYQQQMQAG